MAETTDIAGWIDQTWDPSMSLAAWWRALADAGHAFPSWPKGMGGRNASRSDARAISSALGEAGVIAPPGGNGPNMGGPTLLAHATPEQHERFVAPMARGETAWCQLFSEPGAGSDLAGLGTKAERDGDEFVITGQKVWNSAADVSEWGMLLARTNTDVPKHRGISFMMIDMLQPGVEVRPLVQMNGGTEFCEVFLTEARARVGDVIGAVDDGWNVAKTTLAHERAAAASGRARGVVQAAAGSLSGNLTRSVGDIIDEARATNGARREILFSSRNMIKLAQELGRTANPVIRQLLSDYHIQSEVYRLTNQRSAGNAKTGKLGPEASIGKLALAMLAHRSRDISMLLAGADGMLVGDDAFQAGRIQQAALSSFIPSIGGGTNEIQRNIIGERTLGLPREPSADADIAYRDLPKN